MLKRLRGFAPGHPPSAGCDTYRLPSRRRSPMRGARQATGRPRRERLPWDPPLVRWLNRSLGYLPGASVGTGASGRAAATTPSARRPGSGAPRHSAGCARGHGADPCLEGPGSSRPDPNSQSSSISPSTTAPLCCEIAWDRGCTGPAVQLVLADFVRAQPLDLPEQGVARLAFLRRRRRDVRHEHPGAHRSMAHACTVRQRSLLAQLVEEAPAQSAGNGVQLHGIPSIVPRGGAGKAMASAVCAFSRTSTSRAGEPVGGGRRTMATGVMRVKASPSAWASVPRPRRQRRRRRSSRTVRSCQSRGAVVCPAGTLGSLSERP